MATGSFGKKERVKKDKYYVILPDNITGYFKAEPESDPRFYVDGEPYTLKFGQKLHRLRADELKNYLEKYKT